MMKKIIVLSLLSCVLFISSCSKEEQLLETKSNPDYIATSGVSQTTNSQNSTVYTLETPIQQSYLDHYLNWLNVELAQNSYLQDKHNQLGTLHLNYAILDGAEDNQKSYSFLSIPYMSGDDVTGVLMFFVFDGSIYMDIASREDINGYVNVNFDPNNLMFRSNIVNKLCLYDLLLQSEGVDNSHLYNWMSDVLPERNKNASSRECYYIITTWVNIVTSNGEILGGYIDQTVTFDCDDANTLLNNVGNCLNCDVTGAGVDPIPTLSNGVSGAPDRDVPDGPTLVDLIKSILDTLSPKDKDCSKKMGGSGLMVLQSFINTLLKHPCVDEDNIGDILANILGSLCEDTDENPTLEDLNQLIESGSFSPPSIVVPDNFATDCPCFSNILNSLNQGGTGNWICDMIYGIDATPGSIFTQKIELYEGNTYHNQLNTTTGVATLLIPQSDCEGQANDLGTIAKFLHEFLHGHLFNLLFMTEGNYDFEDIWIPNENYPGYYTVNPDHWFELVKAYNNVEVVNNDHHTLFFTHLQDILRNALHDLNGGVGNPSDYDYFVHLLLSTQSLVDSEWADELGIQDFDISDLNNPTTQTLLQGWSSIGGKADGSNPDFVLNCN